MATLTFEGKPYPLHQTETVLDALLRQGISIPYSCRAGACQSCIMQVAEGKVPAAAQEGLKETFKAQGYFLACICKPENNLTIRMPSLADTTVPVILIGKEALCHNVMLLRLKPEALFECRPGQYISLIRGDGLARSYSIANIPEQDGFLEIHIRYVPNGAMSVWAFEKAEMDDLLHIRGPAGECFYVPDTAKEFGMLLVGTGTGLAPLYAIVKEALRQKHQGKILLIHGALQSKDLYCVQALRKLAAQYPQFRYIPCIAKGEGTEDIEVGNIEDIVGTYLPEVKDLRAYICGDPTIVEMLKKTIFMAGVASQHIHSDAFLFTKT